jgi:hypothetical protein
LRNRVWLGIVVSGALLLAGVLGFAQTSTTTPKKPVKKHTATANSTHKTSSKRRKSRKTATSRKRGQQAIDPKRAQEIQEALIREHYLTGEPAGAWNDASQRAMQKYQADHGWQSKQVPDSRALIKLGLGPDHEHLLNPESAMTTQPEARHSAAAPASTDNQ